MALFLAVAWGLHRMSRTAAVFGLVLYLAERLFMMFETGPKGIILTVVFALLFGGGIRGTFAFHRFRAAGADPALADVFS